MAQRPEPNRSLFPGAALLDGLYDVPSGVRDALWDALDDGPQAVALFDPADRLAYANAMFRQGWGVAGDDFPTFSAIMRAAHDRGVGALIDTTNIEDWLAKADRMRRHGKAFRAFEVDLHDGRWFWLTERRIREGWILLIGQDITALKHNEQTLRAARDAAVKVSLTDPLTQLANRRHAMDQLDALFASGQTFHLALVDIDHFKRINDTMGHAVGDELLVHVSRVLAQRAGADATVARLAGDEFAVISAAGLGRDAFLELLRGLVADAALPVRTKSHTVRVGLSVGAASAPADGESPTKLIAAADAAMYDAKRSGRATVRAFEPRMDGDRHPQAELCRELPAALAKGELVPFYQPIVDLRSGVVCALEALVRWNHPARGLLGPAAFASAFEDPDLAVAIDNAVLEQALADMKGWVDCGLPISAVNVNASDAQLYRTDLIQRVDALLRRNGLDAGRLKIEVVETAFLGRDPERVAATIDGLADLGVTCALDDFGTGHASLTHLRQFRVGRIKIDCSFVANICSDRFDRGLVRGIIELGRSVGLHVTAEGVETPEQLALLREFGCACAQGHLIGRPSAAADVPAAISRWYARFAALDANGCIDTVDHTGFDLGAKPAYGTEKRSKR